MTTKTTKSPTVGTAAPIQIAHEAAAFHGLAIDDEEAGWLVWNRTAYPFCSHTHMICQLSEHFRSIRSITTKDPT